MDESHAKLTQLHRPQVRGEETRGLGSLPGKTEQNVARRFRLVNPYLGPFFHGERDLEICLGQSPDAIPYIRKAE